MPAPESYPLRILHISDLHERGPREPAPWRRRRVLGAAWEQNLDALLASGPIDLLCFTGDAADWAKPEEYAAAGEFFLALLDKLALSAERLFLVPGNHDIDRSLNPQAWEKLRNSFREHDAFLLARWLQGSAPPPPGVEPSWLELTLQRQAAYQNWLVALGKADLRPEHHAHGKLGYRISLNLPALPFPVQIIGLDSAWLAGDDHDAQKLCFTDEQIMRHACDHSGAKLPGLRLALCHHPLWDMADHALARNLLAEHVDILLRGHLHAATQESFHDPDRTLLELAAGCLYEGHRADQYPNSCQLIQLNLDREGRILSTDVRYRSWSKSGGHWHNDDSRYQNSLLGRTSGELVQPKVSALALDQSKTIRKYDGKDKLLLKNRLDKDWRSLADYLGIPPADQNRFEKGYEAGDIWVWLEIREKLHLLPESLSAIGRLDLAQHYL